MGRGMSYRRIPMQAPMPVSVIFAGLEGPRERKQAMAEYLIANQTASERTMARVLHHLGISAKPQVPILGWIVDFYDSSTRTVIEVDGDSHSGKQGADEHRDQAMREAGYRVIRVTNDEVRHFLQNLADPR